MSDSATKNHARCAQGRKSVSRFRLRRLAAEVFDACIGDLSVPTQSFGKEAVWNVCNTLLPRKAVIFSGGVGKDISTEKELAEHLDATVHLFDPSPTGIATMSLPENQDERIHFYAKGLAAQNKAIAFNAPDNFDEGSFRSPGRSGDGTHSFECVRLSEFIKETGGHADLLKLDIEGFEYEVIPDVLNAGLRPTQICVEFHHFMPGFGLKDTVLCITALGDAGYRLARKKGCDYTFVLAELLG